MYYPLQSTYYQPSKTVLPPYPYYSHFEQLPQKSVAASSQENNAESREGVVRFSPVPKSNYFYNNILTNNKTLNAYSANSYEAFKQSH